MHEVSGTRSCYVVPGHYDVVDRILAERVVAPIIVQLLDALTSGLRLLTSTPRSTRARTADLRTAADVQGLVADSDNIERASATGDQQGTCSLAEEL